MKHPFLKKLMNLLEKEVCQEDSCKEVFSPHYFKPLHSEKKEGMEKPINIASKCLKSHETVLSEGVTVKGELHFDKQLRINGCFEGHLKACGKVIVGPKGLIKGDIELDEAEIHGKVMGDIKVKKLSVAPTAEIFGNIYAQYFDFQKGAKLVGQIEITPSSDKIKLFEEPLALQNLG